MGVLTKEEIADRALDAPTNEEAQQWVRLAETQRRQASDDRMTAAGMLLPGIAGAVAGVAAPFMNASSAKAADEEAVRFATKIIGQREAAEAAVDAAASPTGLRAVSTLPDTGATVPSPTMPRPAPPPDATAPMARPDSTAPMARRSVPPPPPPMGSVDELPLDEALDDVPPSRQTYTTKDPTLHSQKLDRELSMLEQAEDSATRVAKSAAAAREGAQAALKDTWKGAAARGLGVASSIADPALLVGKAFSDIGEAGDFEANLRHLATRSGPQSGPIQPGTLTPAAVKQLSADPGMAKRLFDDGVLSHALYSSLSAVPTSSAPRPPAAFKED